MFRIADHIASATPVSEGSHLYKALRSDGRTSAVQLFPFVMTTEQYSEFIQHANHLAEVASRYHINIPAIMNWGYTQSGDFAFIEREWIEGHDLRLSHGDKRITVDEVGTIAEQMSKALTHCHNVGIVHGNISREHILWDQKREQYCLTGFRFGLQLSEPASRSTTNTSLQESLKEKDAHDLGLVLFQLVREHLLTADVSNLSQLNKSLTNEKLKDGNVLPAWLITCINRAMSMGEEKFSSAHEMYSYVILHHKTPMPANKWYRSKPQQPLKARETQVVKTGGTTRKKLRSVLHSGVERGKQEMRFVFDRRIAAGLVIAGLLAGFSIIAQNRENKRNHILAPRVIANGPQVDTTVVEQPAQNTGSVVEEKKTARPKKSNKKIAVVQKPASDSTTDIQTGTTSIGAYKVRSKAYFHNEPDETTRRNAFIVHWNNAVLHPLKEENDFVYVVFTNHEGQTSKGWLRKKDLLKL